jgi:hypothetical protein
LIRYAKNVLIYTSIKTLAMSTRRNFLQNAGLLTGGSVLASALGNESFAYFKNNIMPSDRVNIGGMGLNGMG